MLNGIRIWVVFEDWSCGWLKCFMDSWMIRFFYVISLGIVHNILVSYILLLVILLEYITGIYYWNMLELEWVHSCPNWFQRICGKARTLTEADLDPSWHLFQKRGLWEVVNPKYESMGFQTQIPIGCILQSSQFSWFPKVLYVWYKVVPPSYAYWFIFTQFIRSIFPPFQLTLVMAPNLPFTKRGRNLYFW